MKAAVLYGPMDLRLESINKPALGRLDVLIEIKANGLCGSDIHFFKEGRLGPFEVTSPYVPGHEASGVIEAVGEEVEGFKIGDRVVIEPGIPCRLCEWCKSGRYNLCPQVRFLSAPPINGTLSEYVSVPFDFVYKFPDRLTYEEAALVEPLAVGLHAINRGGLRPGMSIAIFGAGPIGLMILQCARASGAGEIFIIDKIPMRLEMAERLGATKAINAAEKDAVEEVLELTHSRGVDVLFEASGNSKVENDCLRLAKRGGVIVLVGWPDQKLVPYKLEDILDKELDIRGINRYANAYQPALGLLEAGQINLRAMITHRYPFNQVCEAFGYVSEHPDQVIKAVVVN
ncbi:MAG TPA: NAD(P)-dependent alcohol dehydrogenase [Firmicutes bacterium]|nr:NAD(P)-dependent alcohol dehydrogenase [Bacillota bacterium]